jgi:hypothetical protein
MQQYLPRQDAHHRVGGADELNTLLNSLPMSDVFTRSVIAIFETATQKLLRYTSRSPNYVLTVAYQNGVVLWLFVGEDLGTLHALTNALHHIFYRAEISVAYCASR